MVFITNYYDLDNNNKSSNNENNLEAKSIIQKKYRVFQDVNIMIFLCFGILRAFIEHHSWSSIALTFIGGVLSFEFGLFVLIFWSSFIIKSWYQWVFNFQHLLDANFCGAAIVNFKGSSFWKIIFSTIFCYDYFRHHFFNFKLCTIKITIRKKLI